MPNFASAGQSVRLISDGVRISSSLAPAFYIIQIDPQTGELYLDRVDPFELPSRFYGDLEERATRILGTINDRPGSTGILLNGDKGSGKTLLGKKLAVDLVAQGQPCIIVNKPVTGDMLGLLLQRIQQPLTVFFDEFEKVYAPDKQEAMLTVLDGVYPMRITAILTTNDADRVIQPLIDRPGRVYYNITYHGLSVDFVRDYALERLNNKDHTEELVRLAALIELNFDQLQAVVEEMNRYDETVTEAIQYLNVSLDVGEKDYITIDWYMNGQKMGENSLLSFSLTANLTTDDEEETLTFYAEVPNDQKHRAGFLRGLPSVRWACERYPFKGEKLRSAWDKGDTDFIPETFPRKIDICGPFKVQSLGGGVLRVSAQAPERAGYIDDDFGESVPVAQSADGKHPPFELVIRRSGYRMKAF